MKKKLLLLIGASALILASCGESGTTEADVENMYKNADVSAYSLSQINYVAKEDLTTADVWFTATSLDSATVSSYEETCTLLFTSIRSQTSLASGAFSKEVSKFSNYNPLDKALAEKYHDTVEYLVEGGKASASYEGAHTFTSEDELKFDHGAYAFSYVGKYNGVGLLESATLIASFVQKEEGKDATFMRTYKSYVNLTWTVA